ncbi:MAG TPA: SDR family oxidoreductase [Kaistiaceae bacterium]|nr:SDR family oxidoreductase [Kaistiaceae bacterium]
MTTGHFRSLFDLTDRAAVVTGACGILGRRLSAALADFGAKVAVVDLDSAAVEELSGEIAETYGAATLGVVCDVSDPISVEALMERVERELGPVRIVSNNAATKTDDLAAFLTPPEDYVLETWRKVNAVNLDGAFLVAQAAGRRMIAHGRGGSIIQTASIYGILGPDNRIYDDSLYMGRPISTPPVYAASKGGIVSLTHYFATVWAPHNIRVNTLTPGGIVSGQNAEFMERYGRRVPLGRMAQSDEMTGALIFLASDAASYVTGQNMVVDGGLSAW